MSTTLKKERLFMKKEEVRHLFEMKNLVDVKPFVTPNQASHNHFFTARNLECDDKVVVRIWDAKSMDKRLLTESEGIPKELQLWMKIMELDLPVGLPMVKSISSETFNFTGNVYYVLITNDYYSKAKFKIGDDLGTIVKAIVGLEHICVSLLDLMEGAHIEDKNVLFRISPQDVIYSKKFNYVLTPCLFNLENFSLVNDWEDLDSYAYTSKENHSVERSAQFSIKKIYQHLVANINEPTERDLFPMNMLQSCLVDMSLGLCQQKNSILNMLRVFGHLTNLPLDLDPDEIFAVVDMYKPSEPDDNSMSKSTLVPAASAPDMVNEMFRGLNFGNSEDVSFEFIEPNEGGGFDAIAGMDDIKRKLKRIFSPVDEMNDLSQYYGLSNKSHAYKSRGVLLHGPSGSGKSFIAKSLANEMKLPYIIVDEITIGGAVVHETPMKITRLFKDAIECAKQRGGCFVIIDEIDSFTPKKDNFYQSKIAETNAFLTSLQECSAFPVYVVGTTNRPDIIEPSILRTERLGEKIYVPLPNAEARKQIFQHALRYSPVDDEINYDLLASLTQNFTAADIKEMVVDETIRKCIETGTKTKITSKMLVDTISQVHPSVSESDRKFYEQICGEYASQSTASHTIGFQRH